MATIIKHPESQRIKHLAFRTTRLSEDNDRFLLEFCEDTGKTPSAALDAIVDSFRRAYKRLSGTPVRSLEEAHLRTASALELAMQDGRLEAHEKVSVLRPLNQLEDLILRYPDPEAA